MYSDILTGTIPWVESQIILIVKLMYTYIHAILNNTLNHRCQTLAGGPNLACNAILFVSQGNRKPPLELAAIIQLNPNTINPRIFAGILERQSLGRWLKDGIITSLVDCRNCIV